MITACSFARCWLDLIHRDPFNDHQLIIGLLVGIFRTLPLSENPVGRFLQRIVNGLLTIYIEVFRGTPMMVQAMVIFYGTALAFGVSMNRTLAAVLIVSINTGAYMSEIVRGGIFAVDDGQFEAAQAIGMTHWQTMIKVVLPQVMRNILPATGNEIIINIKDTAVLSVISVADLFSKVHQPLERTSNTSNICDHRCDLLSLDHQCYPDLALC